MAEVNQKFSRLLKNKRIITVIVLLLGGACFAGYAYFSDEHRGYKFCSYDEMGGLCSGDKCIEQGKWIEKGKNCPRFYD